MLIVNLEAYKSETDGERIQTLTLTHYKVNPAAEHRLYRQAPTYSKAEAGVRVRYTGKCVPSAWTIKKSCMDRKDITNYHVFSETYSFS